MAAEQLQRPLDAPTPTPALVSTASRGGPEERVTAVMHASGNEFRAAVDDNALPSYAGVKLTVGSIEVTTEPSAASTMGTLTRARSVASESIPLTAMTFSPGPADR